MAALGLTWLPQYSSAPLPQSQLFEILVTDSSPERAMAVVNELARQVIRQSPTSVQPQEQEHQDFVDSQLLYLEQKITETLDEISVKEKQLGDLVGARQIADAQSEIEALQTKLTNLQTSYTTLLANSQRGANNTVSVLEWATLPKTPIGPSPIIIVLLSTVVALVITAGAVYLLEYLDDTLKTPEDVNKVLNLPVVGEIMEIEKTGEEDIFVARQPRSFVAEAFRTLRTNLEFAGVDAPLKTILISSASSAEGKTNLAINLATVIAQGGKKVVLLDADMRKPSIHESLDLPNNKGLSEVFRGSIDLHDALTLWLEEKIFVVTAGSPPPNPTDLLNAKKMDTILKSLQQVADTTIIDGPPFLVADAAILSNKVDGVLLVIRHGFTRKNEAKAMLEQVKRSGAKIVGVVINRVPRKSAGYYGRHQYYEGSDDSESGGKKKSSAKSKKPGFLGTLKKERAQPIAQNKPGAP
jgi:capsular exopolysaccharide synthesis family protein